MSAKFFALLTVIGANKLAKATALGTTLKITQMAVGDGGGMLPTPDTQQTRLVGEKRRAGLNTLFVDPKNDSQIIAEQVIPENEGGYWIREIGLFDDEGSLIAVGNCPETYKPQLQEGSGRTQTIRMILTVSHTESVELKVDPSVILATREFVNDAIESASKQTLEEVAKLYATKAELSTGLSKVQKSADAANTNANSRVPSTRKVNNKPLSTDISLTAGDVGAATPAQVNEAKTAASNAQATANSGVSKADAAQKTANDAVSKANAAQTAANNANTNANGRVPSTRKINNKPLSTDITLTASDVGAATPAQVDKVRADLTELVVVDLDLSKLNENTYYPIILPLVTSRRYAFKVFRTLGQYRDNKPSDATHNTKGFAMIVEWQVSGSGWGTQSENRIIDNFDWQWTNQSPVMGPAQLTNGSVEYIYLRGGAKYQLTKHKSVNHQIITSTYTNNKQSVAPKGFVANEVPKSSEQKANEIANAVSQLEKQTAILATSIYPIGAPIPWSQATVPSGYLICNGQTFNKSTYPKLAVAYPSGKLPDLRGEFIRGLDSGRGIDAGRSVLSAQKGNSLLSSNIFGGLSSSESNKWHKAINYIGITGTDNDGGYGVHQQIEGANGNETRPRNIAFLYIVRAA
ncbi:phage tail-collar fiber domain-containing protein [Proteus mirabilis]|uniref:phage tail-collar fiber domain-containing protein n=1 Tax=Proteus mirabilis TaxID=584 RepID=UPI001EF78007|nr:phage tail protein [Proteus mirabilis]